MQRAHGLSHNAQVRPFQQTIQVHHVLPRCALKQIRSFPHRNLDATAKKHWNPHQLRLLPKPTAIAADVEPASPTSTQGAAETKHELYQWTKQWWPLAEIDQLDPTRPQQKTLLGQDLVIWRDGAGAWRVFADACPHRLAPLSQGRVEADGTLLCAYHAWRFDGKGACTSIPQARDDSQEALAKSSPRACATAHPAQVLQGILWVWGEGGPSAAVEAAGSTPRTIPELEDTSGRVVSARWRQQELPYGHDYFVENVVDPAHVVVSHHKLAGDRYRDPAPIVFETERELTKDDGFKFFSKPRGTFGKLCRRNSTDFAPPCLVRIQADFEGGARTLLALYSAPSRPGHTLQTSAQIMIAGEDGTMPKGIGGSSGAAAKMPVWLGHMLAPLFLHQDAVFLHWQEKIAASGAHRRQRAVDKYFTPTSSDKMVLALRTWFERHAPQGIPFRGVYEGAPLPPPERDDTKLFDSSHVKHCRICSAALKNLQKGRVAAWAVAALAAVSTAVFAASGAAAKAAALVASGAAATPAAAATSAALSAPPPGAVISFAVAVLAAGAAALMARIISLYHVFPFSHADNN